MTLTVTDLERTSPLTTPGGTPIYASPSMPRTRWVPADLTAMQHARAWLEDRLGRWWPFRRVRRCTEEPYMLYVAPTDPRTRGIYRHWPHVLPHGFYAHPDSIAAVRKALGSKDEGGTT